MTSAAILAKLNVKNCRFDVGNGGLAELTQTDIAAALSMCNFPDGVYYFARAKYCGDASVVGQLEAALWGCIVDMSIAQKWNMRDGAPEYMRRMAILARAESLDHGRCRRCGGTARIGARTSKYGAPDSKEQPCPSCRRNEKGEATGFGREISGRARARFFGMSAPTYSNYWESRYRAVLSLTDEWDSDINYAINRQFD